MRGKSIKREHISSSLIGEINFPPVIHYWALCLALLLYQSRLFDTFYVKDNFQFTIDATKCGLKNISANSM